MKVWDLRNGKDVLTFKGHTSSVTSVSFSPDGGRLASAGEDKTVKVWDAYTGLELLNLKGHTSSVTSLCFSPNAERLASASADKTVKVWDVRSHEESLTEFITFKGHAGVVRHVSFSPDGQRVASDAWDSVGTVKVWDGRTGVELLTLKAPQDGTSGVNHVSFSADGQRVAAASAGTVTLWDASSGTTLLTKMHPYVHDVCFSPDGQRLASASFFGTVKVWDAHTGKDLLPTLKHGKMHDIRLRFSPRGERLASASEDNAMKVWDAQTGEDLHTLKGHTSRVWGLSFSPDGQRLASASSDHSVKVWDVRAGVELLILKGHADGVLHVTFSPDGQFIASASGDKTVKLWDARNGMHLLTLKSDARWFEDLTWGPDGLRVASTGFGEDGTTVKLLDTRWGEALPTPEGPPTKKELAYREYMSRAKIWWHEAEARRHENETNWYAAAFHRGQLVLHEPSHWRRWQELESACARLGSSNPAFAVCRLLLAADPGLAPVFFHRARLHAQQFSFHEATADNVLGMVLASKNPVGWPWWAYSFYAEGDKAAADKDWPAVRQFFAYAAMLERQEAWIMSSLAWAQLAGGNKDDFASTCRYLLDRYRSCEDVADLFRLSVHLGMGLDSGNCWARLAGQPVAEAVLQQMQAERNQAIVVTACIAPDHGLPPRELVRLAQANVKQARTADYLQTLGAAQYRAGDFKEALDSLTAAAQLQGENVSNWTALFQAITYARLQEKKKAHEGLNRVLPRRETSAWQQRLIFDTLFRELSHELGAKNQQ